MRSAFERLINRRARTSATDGAILISRRARRKKRSGSKRAETAERASGSKYPSPSISLSLKVRYLMTRHGGNLMRKFSLIGAYWSHVPLCLLAVGRSVNSQRRLWVCYRARELFWWARALRKISLEHYRRAREQRPNWKCQINRVPQIKGKKNNATRSGEKYFALLSYNQMKYIRRGLHLYWYKITVK